MDQPAANDCWVQLRQQWEAVTSYSGTHASGVLLKKRSMSGKHARGVRTAQSMYHPGPSMALRYD